MGLHPPSSKDQISGCLIPENHRAALPPRSNWYLGQSLGCLATNALQITNSSSDADYLLQLIPVIKEVRRIGRPDELIAALDQVSTRKEREIERICNSNHQEFVKSVQQ